MLSVIQWGLPNQNHPFSYYMDEWHQMQSIRALYKHGSPNIAGAANGTIFHFILSGIFLLPFIAIKIINPFVIKSSVDALAMQHMLFILLRINTILFGILSIVVLAHIAKKYLKIDIAFPLIFFIFNPVWLYQSNYFKYDVALTFWILLSLLFIFKFSENPTLKKYLLAGAICALSLATKISAVVMLPIYLYSYFHFVPRKKRNYTYLSLGLGLFILLFLGFGIPDLILQKGDIHEYLTSNLVQTPKVYDNFIFEFRPWWLYLLFGILPLDLGYVFLFLSLLAILYLVVFFMKKGVHTYKKELFLLISCFFFSVSLFPLNLGASGNRLLVLLPFLSLLLGIFIKILSKKMFMRWNIQAKILLSVLVIIQIYQSLVVVVVKWLPDPRSEASEWLQKNVKRESIIGIENIPIYQQLPDIVLKEFYTKQEKPGYPVTFRYKVINESSKILPQYVIITSREFETNYLKHSSKKSLVLRLHKEGYLIVKEFKPSPILYRVIGNERNFYMSGIVSTPTISIYKNRFYPAI